MRKCYEATMDYLQAYPQIFSYQIRNRYAFVTIAFQYVIVTTTTNILSSKEIYQYIPVCSTQHCRDPSQKFLISDSGYNKEYIQVMGSVCRMKFFPHSPDVQKAATAIKFRLQLTTITNFIKIYEIRNAIFVPLETLGHCTNLGPVLLAPDSENHFSGATPNN